MNKKKCLFEKHLSIFKDPLKNKNFSGNVNDVGLTYGYKHDINLSVSNTMPNSFFSSEESFRKTINNPISNKLNCVEKVKKKDKNQSISNHRSITSMNNSICNGAEIDNFKNKKNEDDLIQFDVKKISMLSSTYNESNKDDSISLRKFTKNLMKENGIRSNNKSLNNTNNDFNRMSNFNRSKTLIKKKIDYTNFHKNNNQYIQLDKCFTTRSNNRSISLNKSSKSRKCSFFNTNNSISIFPNNNESTINNNSCNSPIKSKWMNPKTPFKFNTPGDIRHQVNLLFGIKSEIPIEIKKEINSQETSKRSTLLNKLHSVLKGNVNVFTKENLFEEVETEEYDNPTYRDYMEDMVLAEVITSKTDHKKLSLDPKLVELNNGNKETISSNKSPYKKSSTLNLKNASSSITSEDKQEVTLFAIFDGHGGYEVSSKARELLPKEIHSKINLSTGENSAKILLAECFEKTDKELMTKLASCDDMGSTCTLCYIGKNKTNRIIFTANIGDSHAYLVSNKKATRLTQEHKCDNQEELVRLKELNTIIINNRLFGQLALTRAFCDRKMKPFGLIATPSVASYVVKEKPPHFDSYLKDSTVEYDMFLVIASDGIWDVVKEEDLMKILTSAENSDKSTKELTKILMNFAIENKSTDNISVIVVKL